MNFDEALASIDGIDGAGIDLGRAPAGLARLPDRRSTAAGTRAWRR